MTEGEVTKELREILVRCETAKEYHQAIVELKIKIEKSHTKYLIYAITTIRDAIAYNEHNVLNGKALDRIEEELLILEGIEDTEYTKEQFGKFHFELLELNVALLPTTEKAIKRFGE